MSDAHAPIHSKPNSITDSLNIPNWIDNIDSTIQAASSLASTSSSSPSIDISLFLQQHQQLLEEQLPQQQLQQLQQPQQQQQQQQQQLQQEQSNSLEDFPSLLHEHTEDEPGSSSSNTPMKTGERMTLKPAQQVAQRDLDEVNLELIGIENSSTDGTLPVRDEIRRQNLLKRRGELQMRIRRLESQAKASQRLRMKKKRVLELVAHSDAPISEQVKKFLKGDVGRPRGTKLVRPPNLLSFDECAAPESPSGNSGPPSMVRMEGAMETTGFSHGFVSMRPQPIMQVKSENSDSELNEKNQFDVSSAIAYSPPSSTSASLDGNHQSIGSAGDCISPGQREYDTELMNKLDWKGTIKQILSETPENRMRLKKLRKAVIGQFTGYLRSLSETEMQMKFNERLEACKRITIEFRVNSDSETIKYAQMNPKQL